MYVNGAPGGVAPGGVAPGKGLLVFWSIKSFSSHYSFGLRGSILKSKIINNAVTIPVLRIKGSLVMFRSAPDISNNTPIASKIRTILPNYSSPFNCSS